MKPFLSALAVAAVTLGLLAGPAAAQSPFVQIPWGEDLSKAAIQYRDDHDVSPRRNVAVFEFRRRDGRLATIAIDSTPYTPRDRRGKRIEGHSERRLANILRSYGIHPSRVTRVYTELHPCSMRGRHCSNMLRTTFRKATVYYSFEYGHDAASKRRGKREHGRTIREHNKQRKQAQRALQVPGGKPPSGPLVDQLARPGRPGGIDFSSLELRYVSNAGPRRGGVGFSMRGLPSAAPGDPAVGLATAKRASDAFFAWLTLPPQTHWVNLGPFEANQIMDPQFARTDAAHVLLEADLELKDVIWPLTHPATPNGARFWRELDALYGNDAFKTNHCLMFRVWIEPAPATVREDGDELYILDAPLAVKLETIDAGRVDPRYRCPAENPAVYAAKQEIYRRLLTPGMSYAVNTAPEYAELRRVYVSRVAAEWVRQRGGRRTALGRLVDTGRVDRWVANPPWNPADVFNRFLKKYYNPDYRYQRKIPRPDGVWTLNYVFGGVDFSKTPRRNVSRRDFRSRWPRLASQARGSVRRARSDAARNEVWMGARAKRGKDQPRIRAEARIRRRGRA